MKTSQITQTVQLHLEIPTASIFLMGDPGTGKTSIPRQVAAAHKIPFYYHNIPITEATEAGGIPYVTDTNHMAYALLDNIPLEGPGIILLDEFSKGDRIVQNCYSEMLQERTLRGRTISPECLIVCTGNKRSNRAGDNEIPTHIRDRVTFFDVDVDKDDWLAYAAIHGIDDIVRGFIARFGVEYLSKLDTAALSSPSPRGWERVSRALRVYNQPASEHLIYDMVAGTVGAGIANEFEGFRRLATRLPHPNTIFNDPLGSPIFQDEISIQYLLCMQLATAVTKQTANAMFTYISRLNADMATVCVKDVDARDTLARQTSKSAPRMMECSEGTKWASRNAKYLL